MREVCEEGDQTPTCLGGHIGGGERMQAADVKMHPVWVHFRVCLEGGVGVEDKQPNTANVPIWVRQRCSDMEEAEVSKYN